MMKRKFKLTVNNYCMGLALILIVSGCASGDKKSQLLSLQQKRIRNLEKQLKHNEKIIGKMKQERWVNAPVKKDEALALKPLKKFIKQKKWSEALRLSSQLKRQYPRSARIRIYRHKIFKTMGLMEQASNEREAAKRILTSKRTSKKRSKNEFK